ncbi:MAG TPA: hypothetical protein DDW71_06305 [Lactobacillus sp.]|nr:hypothetical protein [Lactobacillus sp.]
MNFQFDMQEILNPNHELTQDQIHSLRNEFNQKVQYSKVTQFKEPKTIRFSDDIEINIQELH